MGARKRATTMYAGREKKRCSAAVSNLGTTVGYSSSFSFYSFKIHAAEFGVPSCSTTLLYSQNSCERAVSLPSNSPFDSWNSENTNCSRGRPCWNQKYCWHKQHYQYQYHQHNQQQQGRSCRDLGTNVDVIDFSEFSRSGNNYLIAKKGERSLLTVRSHDDCSVREVVEEEKIGSEVFCTKGKRFVYQPSHNLLTSTFTKKHTASSSSSSSSSSSLSSSLRSSSSRFQNPTRFRRYQRCPEHRQYYCLYTNLRIFIYWHIFSLLACFAATGFCLRASVRKSSLNINENLKSTEKNVSDLPFQQQLMTHSATSAFITTTDNISKTVTQSTTEASMHLNPFLRHLRSTSVRLGLALDSVCYVWSSVAPNDLCKLTPWARYHFLQQISIFNRDCSEENNIKAVQLFRLTGMHITDEEDLRTQAQFLQDGIEGQACILAPAGSQQCLSCFQKVDQGLKEVDKAYAKFNLTLHRFDCMLAVDTASATRPFSPVGSCADCKNRYRKWLLVHFLDIWSLPPCINWCYYAQLACPHLATSKVVDYAGHPSFQCRDLYISQMSAPKVLASTRRTTSSSSRSRNQFSTASTCECLHPCDIEEFDSLVDTKFISQQNLPRSYSNFIPLTSNEDNDFFPAWQHCKIRRRICSAVVHQRYVVRRSSVAVARENFHLSNSGDRTASVLGYAIGIFHTVVARLFLDTIGVGSNRTKNSIQKVSHDTLKYVTPWSTKYYTRQRLQFVADSATTPSTATISRTTALITPTFITSDADWRKIRWSACSGILIYTLFVPILLLR